VPEELSRCEVRSNQDATGSEQRRFCVFCSASQPKRLAARRAILGDIFIPNEGTDFVMTNERVFALIFASVYPHYVKKAETKGRTKEELDQVIRWLTGYTKAGLEKVIRDKVDLRTFFDKAPRFNPNASLIKGAVCGLRVEDIEDPLMQKIRYMDKLIDELAKGKKMEKILRRSE
jgi:hypothetical protein